MNGKLCYGAVSIDGQGKTMKGRYGGYAGDTKRRGADDARESYTARPSSCDIINQNVQ